MIKLNNIVDNKDFEKRIQQEIKQFDITGYISIDILEIFFNAFSWIYFDKEILYEDVKNKESIKLKKLIDTFDLKYFKGDSLYYSAVLFYKKLSNLINMRSLKDKKILKIKSKQENKALLKKDFLFDNLYNLYAGSFSDIPSNFLLFNDIFNKNEVKQVKHISNYSQILKTTHITNLIKPDLGIKVALKTLQVNTQEIKEGMNKTKIIVLQDASFSMEKHTEKLSVLKAYILNESLKNNFKISWNFCNSDIIKQENYDKNNIKTKNIGHLFKGFTFEIEQLLNNIIDKDIHSILIITDGEDNFDIPFKLRSVKINAISFTFNNGLKANVSKYGKFIKF